MPSDASAVALNVTITNPASAGYLTVYPCGQSIPGSSNLNYSSGETIANLVIAKVGGTGQVCFVSSAGADVLADMAGYFPAASLFTPIPNPVRILDTRPVAPPPPPPPPPPPFQFGPGVHAAIPAGRYQAPGSSFCYWARVTGFSGSVADIIANDHPAGPVILDIAPSDVGVNVIHCGTFTLTS